MHERKGWVLVRREGPEEQEEERPGDAAAAVVAVEFVGGSTWEAKEKKDQRRGPTELERRGGLTSRKPQDSQRRVDEGKDLN